MGAETLPLPSSYDISLVALSIGIAILASYLALDLAGQMMHSVGSSRLGWVIGGGFAMGTGIWSMHFIGMLAFSLPIQVRYHVPLVVLSHLAAVVASSIAMHVASNPTLGNSTLVLGSLLMGLGITAMHYTGMAAMRLQAAIHYDLWLLFLSIVIAITVSFVGLWMAFHLRSETTTAGLRKKLGGAVVMGCAIPSMHYTGMAAASFFPSEMVIPLSALVVDVSSLGQAAITIGTVVVIGFTFLSAAVNRQLSVQAKRIDEGHERTPARNSPTASY